MDLAFSMGISLSQFRFLFFSFRARGSECEKRGRPFFLPVELFAHRGKKKRKKQLHEIKVTTPDDMSIAERFLVERGEVSEKVGAAAAAA